MPDPDSDPLRSRLGELETEIRERVHAVCESPPVDKLDTGELIRFEEELSIATSAAKEAVTLRRRMRVDRNRASAEAEAKEPETSVRRAGSGAGGAPAPDETRS
jgi:hypothetical protein